MVVNIDDGCENPQKQRVFKIVGQEAQNEPWPASQATRHMPERHGFFRFLFINDYMEENQKKVNLFGDPDKEVPPADRTSDAYPDHNPGLKDEKAVKNKGGLKDLLNENDPLEEKKAIEKTSEDRLDEAE